MKIPVLLICALFLCSCVTKKTQKNKHPNFIEITFGNGGGFTGLSNTYFLNNKGEVYELINEKPGKINEISKTEIHDVLGIIAKMGFQNTTFSEKGNMTYFIEIKTNDYTHKVTWADNSDAPEIKNLYKTLVRFLKPK